MSNEHVDLSTFPQPEEGEKLPSGHVLKRLHQAGYNWSQLARIYTQINGAKVTQQGVQWKAASIGYKPHVGSKERVRMIPYTIRREPGHDHGNSALHQRLRDHLTERAGEDLPVRRGALLMNWRGRLQGQVMVYDWEEGWKLTPRTEQDEDLVIRWPESVAKPDPADLDLFRLPPKLS